MLPEMKQLWSYTPNGIYDVYLLPLVFRQVMKSTLTAYARMENKETVQDTLLSNIAANGFKIVTTPANGDCLFHSISFALSQAIQSKQDNVLLQHLPFALMGIQALMKCVPD